MSSKSPWHVEASQYRNIETMETDEIMDWFTGNPGPAMRSQINKWFELGGNHTIKLRVRYHRNGEERSVNVTRHGNRYLVMHKGETLTLEEVTKRLKLELKNTLC